MINIHEAKTHLSKLIERAGAGEEIIIGKAGNPVAKLIPYQENRLPRVPGAWKGKVTIAADFDQLTHELEADWYGNGGS